jgi:hypothetical protein
MTLSLALKDRAATSALGVAVIFLLLHGSFGNQ